MGDMDKSAKQRLAFLFGQSDLFKHFVKEEDLKEGGAPPSGGAYTFEQFIEWNEQEMVECIKEQQQQSSQLWGDE